MTRDQIKAAILEALRARHISGHEKDILLLLTGYGDDPWPSHETIAYRCGCSISTVKRALKRLKEIGWISWERTYRHCGARVVRGTNRYRLHPPAGPYAARSTAHAERGMKTPIKTGFERSIAQQLAAFGVSWAEAAQSLQAVRAKQAKVQEAARPSWGCRLSL